MNEEEIFAELANEALNLNNYEQSETPTSQDTLTVNNIVASFDVGLSKGEFLDVNMITQYWYHSRQVDVENKKAKYANNIIVNFTSPKVTFNISGKGHVTILGATNAEDLYTGSTWLVAALKSIRTENGPEEGPYSHLNIKNFKITNTVINGNLGFPINLEAFEKADNVRHTEKRKQNSQHLPAAAVYKPQKELTVMVYESGSFSIFTAIDFDQVRLWYPDFIKFMQKFAI